MESELPRIFRVKLTARIIVFGTPRAQSRAVFAV